jgi:hypothetical protein
MSLATSGHVGRREEPGPELQGLGMAQMVGSWPFPGRSAPRTGAALTRILISVCKLVRRQFPRGIVRRGFGADLTARHIRGGRLLIAARRVNLNVDIDAAHQHNR